MSRRPARLGTFVFLVFLGITSALRADQTQGTKLFDDVRFEGISSDQLAVDVVVLPQISRQRLLVHDMALQDYLKVLHKGDRISVMVVMDNGQAILQTLSVKNVAVSMRYRALVLFIAAFAFWLVCFLLSGFHPERLSWERTEGSAIRSFKPSSGSEF